MSSPKDLKNIYMVQVSYTYGEDDLSVYLPYASGLLMAYALEDETVRDNYRSAGFVFTREDIDKALDRLEEPYLVGFSNYVWNTRYNIAFAARLKERYPSCIVVFGGHNVSPNESFLEQHPQIDFLIHGEGEEAFCRLLKALCTDNNFSSIANLSYRSPSSLLPVSTQRKRVDQSLENYPSPYLSGIFDKLMQENPQYEFCAILETSRDCPFLCAFCDWGQLRAKTRRFSKQQVLDEIEWMSENKIVYIWGADPNFGMFDDDFDYAQKIVEAKIKNAYPEILSVNYSKTRADNVYRINLLLNEHKLSRGIPLSFQSLNKEVLKNINRENLTLDAFSSLISKYYNAGITAYSELILGLPGESYESFCKGIGLLLEAGQHKTINVYPFELLCNSSLGSEESIKKFSIESVLIPFARLHCSPESQGVTEYSEIVVSTYSMNRDMWKRSSHFANLVQCFHNFGLLRCFAIYLYYEKNLAYEDFYMSFQTFMEQTPKSVSGHFYKIVDALYDKAMLGQSGLHYLDPAFGNIVWSFSEAMYLNSVYNFDNFFEEAETFLSSFEIDREIFEDLLNFQKALIKRPSIEHKEIRLSHDLYSYFDKIYSRDKTDLKKCHNITSLTDDRPQSNWVDYARVNVWWGRNENRNIMSDIKVRYIN